MLENNIYLYILIKKDVVVDGKAADGVNTRHGQAGRMRRVPLLVFGIRHFPAGILELPKPLLVSLTCSHEPAVPLW